jgi:molecular chaperone DnaK
MGQTLARKSVSGRHLRPEVLSAFILKKLRQDAEDKIGSIGKAVITVPAYFDDARRKATQDAAAIAGLEILAIINEPQAAALWYAYSNRERLVPGSVILVYDLGGGTFDATLMRIIDANRFETIATDGDVMLGGKDWDKRLIDYVAGEFMRQTGSDPRDDDVAFQELAQRIEESKRALSKRPNVTVPVTYGGKTQKIPVTRDKFRELTIDLLNRTQTTVELLVADSGLEWGGISGILAVGGSSRMTMVSEMLASISNKEPDMSLDGDLAIAQGAAVYAASLLCRSEPDGGEQFSPGVGEILAGLRHTNVNSHSLGIEIENPDTGRSENYFVIRKNTPIPCSKREIFGLSSSSSSEGASLEIKLLEGDSLSPEACVHLGTCLIDGLPAGLAEDSPVEVTFSYTEDGRVHLRAFSKEIGIEADVHFERGEGISSGDVGKESEIMLKLNVV